MLNSLNKRRQRINLLNELYNCKFKHDLFISIKIPDDLIYQLRFATGYFISKAMGFNYLDNEKDLINNINLNKANEKNITPNGAVVPKKEFQLEYNLFLKRWFEIIKYLKDQNTSFSKIRITPNIRIKFADEIKHNINRKLNTSVTHSDAWLEGPWGLNCHIPLFGDTSKNYLKFFECKNDDKFSDDFLKLSRSYKDMQWVLKYYKPTKFKPIKNMINISDYALLHKTQRDKSCGTRVSIDTTVYIGNDKMSELIDERSTEYLNYIPDIGRSQYVKCNVSQFDKINHKTNSFSHYTNNNTTFIEL